MSVILPQAIQIKLVPSQLLVGLISGVTIACCAVVLLQPIALIFQLVFIALILLSSTYFIARDVLFLLPWSWQMLEVNTKGELTLINKRGQQFQPALAASTFTNAACTLLNFKNKGLKPALPPIIILSTINNREELRRLRVWLRWFKFAN